MFGTSVRSYEKAQHKHEIRLCQNTFTNIEKKKYIFVFINTDNMLYDVLIIKVQKQYDLKKCINLHYICAEV